MNIFSFWKTLLSVGWAPLWFGSPSPPPPDPRIGQAAEANVELGREALAFQKQQYEEAKPRTEAYDKLIAEIVEAQLSAMQKSQGFADDYAEYLRSTFRPLERQIVADAAAFDTEAKREQFAGQAAADVSQAAAVTDAAARRDAARFGINPSDAAFAEGLAGSAYNQALARANAMNQARVQAEGLGFARKMDAASLGRNIPSAQATSQQIAIGAGGAAAGTAGQPLNQYRADSALVNAGYGTAIGANQAAGNLLLGQYQGELNAWNAQQQASAGLFGGLGTAAGLIGSAWLRAGSDKNIKKDKRPVKEAAVLKGIKRLKVESWRYKDGVADEGRHIGPYAQDVQEQFGDEAAPGGKMIDLISMNGIALAGIKGLAKKVGRLEKNIKEIAKRGITNDIQGVVKRGITIEGQSRRVEEGAMA